MTVLALLGSGEFQPWAREVDTWCAEHATGPSDVALVIPTASAPEGEDVFERWGSMGVDHYASIGLAAEVLGLRTRADASDPAIVDAVGRARVLFFSGGNPGYLCETVRDTPFWDAVRAAVAGGAALGGCSAGAVAMGTLAPFVAEDQIEQWVPSLGLLADAFVAPHFDQLDAYAPGLRAQILGMRPPGCVTVGIDEDTALYGDDGDWRVAGRLGVWIGEGEAPDELVSYTAGERVPVRLGLKLS